MPIGKRIETFRKKMKMSQKDLSIALKCSQPNISDYENDRISLPLSSMIYIAETYKVSMDWLLTGKGEMFLNGGSEGITAQRSVVRKTEGSGVIRPFDGAQGVNEVEELKKSIADLEAEIRHLENENKKLNAELIGCLKDLICFQKKELKNSI